MKQQDKAIIAEKCVFRESVVSGSLHPGGYEKFGMRERTDTEIKLRQTIDGCYEKAEGIPLI